MGPETDTGKTSGKSGGCCGRQTQELPEKSAENHWRPVQKRMVEDGRVPEKDTAGGLTMIRVDMNAAEVNKLLNELRGRMRDMTPVMGAVGEVYYARTIQRFYDEVDPDGKPWKPLSPVTLARRRKRGNTRTTILRDSWAMMNSIRHKVSGNTVTIGTDIIYARRHQEGINMPQRRFLGSSKDDDQAVLELLQGYLQADQPLSWFQRLVQRLTGRR